MKELQSPKRVTSLLREKKNIALVAHDHKKSDMIEWAKFNRHILIQHNIIATGTTGKLLEKELDQPIRKLLSGPLGGDLQIGSLISEGSIDLLIFFWDPLSQFPHDPDVKALLRVTVVWNVPVACNRATADFIISSSLMGKEYERSYPDYDAYASREIE